MKKLNKMMFNLVFVILPFIHSVLGMASTKDYKIEFTVENGCFLMKKLSMMDQKVEWPNLFKKGSEYLKLLDLNKFPEDAPFICHNIAEQLVYYHLPTSKKQNSVENHIKNFYEQAFKLFNLKPDEGTYFLSLAVLYWNGHGTEKNQKIALRYIQKAKECLKNEKVNKKAEQIWGSLCKENLTPTLLNNFWLTQEGFFEVPVEVNLKKTKGQIFNKDNYFIQRKIFADQLHINNMEKDAEEQYKLALKELVKIEEKHYLLLADCYWNGKGTKKDKDLALSYIQKAKNQDNDPNIKEQATLIWQHLLQMKLISPPEEKKNEIQPNISENIGEEEIKSYEQEFENTKKITDIKKIYAIFNFVEKLAKQEEKQDLRKHFYIIFHSIQGHVDNTEAWPLLGILYVWGRGTNKNINSGLSYLWKAKEQTTNQKVKMQAEQIWKQLVEKEIISSETKAPFEVIKEDTLLQAPQNISEEKKEDIQNKDNVTFSMVGPFKLTEAGFSEVPGEQNIKKNKVEAIEIEFITKFRIKEIKDVILLKNYAEQLLKDNNEKDAKKYFDLFHKAIRQNDNETESWLFLADCNLNGKGTSENLMRALTYIHRAKEQKSNMEIKKQAEEIWEHLIKNRLKLGLISMADKYGLLEEGYFTEIPGEVTLNEEKIQKYETATSISFEEIVKLKTYAEMLRIKGKNEEAEKWFKLIFPLLLNEANKDNYGSPSYILLADCYLNGKGIEQDIHQAKKYMKKLSEESSLSYPETIYEHMKNIKGLNFEEDDEEEENESRSEEGDDESGTEEDGEEENKNEKITHNNTINSFNNTNSSNIFQFGNNAPQSLFSGNNTLNNPLSTSFQGDFGRKPYRKFSNNRQKPTSSFSGNETVNPSQLVLTKPPRPKNLENWFSSENNIQNSSQLDKDSAENEIDEGEQDSFQYSDNNINNLSDSNNNNNNNRTIEQNNSINSSLSPHNNEDFSQTDEDSPENEMDKDEQDSLQYSDNNINDLSDLNNNNNNNQTIEQNNSRNPPLPTDDNETSSPGNDKKGPSEEDKKKEIIPDISYFDFKIAFPKISFSKEKCNCYYTSSNYSLLIAAESAHGKDDVPLYLKIHGEECKNVEESKRYFESAFKFLKEKIDDWGETDEKYKSSYFYALAELYWKGRGVEKNLMEAIKYCYKAGIKAKANSSIRGNVIGILGEISEFKIKYHGQFALNYSELASCFIALINNKNFNIEKEKEKNKYLYALAKLYMDGTEKNVPQNLKLAATVCYEILTVVSPLTLKDTRINAKNALETIEGDKKNSPESSKLADYYLSFINGNFKNSQTNTEIEKLIKSKNK